jgi:PAS domain S-box-containing protein
VRSLCEPSKILVVDEISTRLSAAQIETLHSELSMLRERGVSVIYFTSNLEEVFRFADRVSFLQSGRILATEQSSNLGKLELVQLSYSHLYNRKELERNNYELFFLKNYYENIINSMPIPLLLLNSQGSIIYVNDKFREEYSIEKMNLAGRHITDILRPGTTESEYFHKKSTQEDRDVITFSNVVLTVADSRESPRLYRIPINDEDNSHLGAILFFDTISLHVNLEQHNKNLRARNRVPLFAHEIRNPLAILSNFLTLIKGRSSSQELREYLERSEKEIKRINNIVSNLMKEEGTASKEAQAGGTNLWVLAEEIKLLVTPMIADSRISVENKTARDLLLTHDEDEIKEVLLNLVLNSIEAINSDGIITIATESEILEDKPHVVIKVSDNGVGISERDLDKVFEPFFSTKTGKERRGLGLTICRDIVDGWKGMIKVDSTLNAGTTVRIFIPQ